MSMFLSKQDIKDLTGRKHRTCQIETLCLLGIEHKVRPDGEIIVLKSHVEDLLSGQNGPSRKSAAAAPDFGALKHA